jgi:hypothetical protein
MDGGNIQGTFDIAVQRLLHGRRPHPQRIFFRNCHNRTSTDN